MNFSERTSKAELHQLYVVEMMSVNQLATRYNTTGTTIRKALVYHGIQMRPNGRARKKPDSYKRNNIPKQLRPAGLGTTVLTEKTLRQLYVEEGRSAVSIARDCNVNPTVIYRLLAYYNIPRGSRPFYEVIGRDRLAQLYCIEKQSTNAIAAAWNVDIQKVQYALDFYNIPQNDRSDYTRAAFERMYPHLSSDDYCNFRSAEWWRRQLSVTPAIELADKLQIPYSALIGYISAVGVKASDFGWSDTWAEREVARWLVELGVDFTRNDKTVIGPLEVDFFIPEHQLAIEINGEYWHCTAQERIHPEYHKDKTRKCLEAGVTLFHFWDADMKDPTKRAILREKVHNFLHHSPNKVFARKTRVVELTADEYRPFYDHNHIQGSPQYYKHNYGLRMGDDLIAAVSLNPKGEGLYLARFATSLNTRVPGGFSKLLSHVIRTLSPARIDTFSNGQYHKPNNVYAACGFTMGDWTPPNYVYYKNGRRLSRQATQKHKLAHVVSNFDPSLSESANMEANGWSKLYDCGHIHYFWTPTTNV